MQENKEVDYMYWDITNMPEKLQEMYKLGMTVQKQMLGEIVNVMMNTREYIEKLEKEIKSWKSEYTDKETE